MTKRTMFGFIWCLVCLLAITATAQAQMSVQVQQAQLRSTPSFLGKIITTIAYAKQVQVVEEQGDWMKVIPAGSSTEGWMHTSALTKKKIILKAGEEDVALAASSDEVALAGKGFNAEVEKEFKAQNSEVDYNAVDKMEKIVISQNQMQAFLTKGGLSPEGGTK
jgi:hypothetical protein